MAITLTVNGTSHTIDTDPERSLLEVLREDLGLTGSKCGCGEGRCRACTVLSDDKPLLSCLTPIQKLDGRNVTTIEGLAGEGELHPAQAAFVAEEGFQCGFCTPGFVMQTAALLRQNATPTDEEIVAWLDASICRCCTYPNILRAAQRAAGRTLS